MGREEAREAWAKIVPHLHSIVGFPFGGDGLLGKAGYGFPGSHRDARWLPLPTVALSQGLLFLGPQGPPAHRPQGSTSGGWHLCPAPENPQVLHWDLNPVGLMIWRGDCPARHTCFMAFWRWLGGKGLQGHGPPIWKGNCRLPLDSCSQGQSGQSAITKPHKMPNL